MELEAGEQVVVALVSQICPTKPSASSATDEAAEQFFHEVDRASFNAFPKVLQDSATITEVLKPSGDEQRQTEALAAGVEAQKMSGGKRAVDSVLSAFALSKFGKAKLRDAGKAIEMGAVEKAKSTAAVHALGALRDLSQGLRDGLVVSSVTFDEFDKKVAVLADAIPSGNAATCQTALNILTACVDLVVKDL